MTSVYQVLLWTKYEYINNCPVRCNTK